MIPPEDALARILALAVPLPVEAVGLVQASGRVLRNAAQAARAQPPFAASAMDGYAVAGDPVPGDAFQVVGQAAAGHVYSGSVGPGQAVRIFTGAPVPEGATRVLIQEDVIRDGDAITVRETADHAHHIRPAKGDFDAGFRLSAPRRLRPVDLALLAAMNVPEVTVSRRPDVAIIATGDELVMPGDSPRDDQIIASNAFALKAIAESEGAQARLLPIAADTEASLRAVFDLARGADVIVTIGGASVGDHDLVGPVAKAMGATRAFYKIAMRPGKPLMAGRMGDAVLLGLPGNPVSSIVCAHLFLRPLLRALQGLGPWPMPTATARLTCDLPANGPRTHYMRAALGPDGTITPFDRQDSSLLTVLAQADALLIQPAHDPGQTAGATMRYLPI
jgi:molybdopterin molybdotransferase